MPEDHFLKDNAHVCDGGWRVGQGAIHHCSPPILDFSVTFHGFFSWLPIVFPSLAISAGSLSVSNLRVSSHSKIQGLSPDPASSCRAMPYS